MDWNTPGAMESEAGDSSAFLAAFRPLPGFILECEAKPTLLPPAVS